jgi:hypothetical protein
MRPTKIGLATRPPISPGLSPATGQRGTAAVRGQATKDRERLGTDVWQLPDSRLRAAAASSTRQSIVADDDGEEEMQLDPPAHGGTSRRLQGLLAWSSLTLLAAIALALAMVVASPAVEPRSQPAPPPTPPMQISPPGGHAMAQ